MQLQSTSDQQDYLRYPPIAVAAPMSVLPEQSASWAYPQPEMTDEQLAFVMCTGMLGRLYVSGRVDGMSEHQRAAVRSAVHVHREIRADLAAAAPQWPLGLPGWADPWLSLAMHTADTTYLAVWRRPDATPETTLSLPHLRGRQIRVDVLYPHHLPAWRWQWSPNTASLTVAPATDEPVSARLFRIHPLPTERPTR
jgi:alpha-galactosidase